MAKITKMQRQQARNLLRISRYNAAQKQRELSQDLATFDKSDAALRQAAGEELVKHDITSEGDRFSQARKLQQSARGVLAQGGAALAGSQLSGVTGMLGERQNADTAETLGTLGDNYRTTRAQLDQGLQSNVDARRDTITSAGYALGEIESGASSGLSNINPRLYKKPGKGKTNFGSKKVFDRWGKVVNKAPTRTGPFLTDADVRGGY